MVTISTTLFTILLFSSPVALLGGVIVTLMFLDERKKKEISPRKKKATCFELEINVKGYGYKNDLEKWLPKSWQNDSSVFVVTKWSSQAVEMKGLKLLNAYSGNYFPTIVTFTAPELDYNIEAFLGFVYLGPDSKRHENGKVEIIAVKPPEGVFITSEILDSIAYRWECILLDEKLANEFLVNLDNRRLLELEFKKLKEEN